MFLTFKCRALTMIFRKRFADFKLVFVFIFLLYICHGKWKYSKTHSSPNKADTKFSSLTFSEIDLLLFHNTLLSKLWPWCNGDSDLKNNSSTYEYPSIILSKFTTDMKLPLYLHAIFCPVFLSYVMHILP